MPAEDIILTIKTLKKTQGLANTYNELIQLKNAGVDVNKPLKTFEKQNKKLYPVIKRVADMNKRFKMELLSVMFGAQMVSGAIASLFQPALEMAGVFELIGIGLAVFFLPAVMALLDPLIGLIDWFLSFPPEVQVLIGSLLGLMGAFFTFVGTEAAIKLFFAGFIQDAAKAGQTIQEHLIDKMGTFASMAGKAYAVSIVFSGIKEISEGKILSGTAELLKGAGIFAVTMGGKNKAFGGWLLTAGLALDMSDKFVNKEKFTTGEIVNQLIQAGIAGWAFGGWWGAGIALVAMIAIEAIVFKQGILANTLDWIDTNIIQPIKDKYALFTGRTPSVEYYVKSYEKGRKATGIGGGQSGISYVPQTGLYKLHTGESVSTAGDTFNSSPTINIYGATSGDLIRQISEAVTRDLASLSRR